MGVKNERVVLAKRPDKNPVAYDVFIKDTSKSSTNNKNRLAVDSPVTEDCFRHEQCDMPPAEQLTPGKCLLRTTYLSVDPGMRGRFNESSSLAYQLDQPIIGATGVAKVEGVPEAGSAFKVGDLVYVIFGTFPWQKYWISDEAQLTSLKVPPGYEPSVALSCLGLGGLTALLGLTEPGKIEYGGNQTLVVSGAAGAIGSLAGQFGRLLGCSTVIGIAGSHDKCAALTKDFGFDSAANYKSHTMKASLTKTCRKGVDVYFDNVGGPISDMVILMMNKNAHIIPCGFVAASGHKRPPEVEEHIKANNITCESFAVMNYRDQYPECLQQIYKWLATHQLKVKESITDGLENAGKAHCGMMRGENLGKQMVKVL